MKPLCFCCKTNIVKSYKTIYCKNCFKHIRIDLNVSNREYVNKRILLPLLNKRIYELEQKIKKYEFILKEKQDG